MKGISKLKDEARKHEQREEWDKAVKAYLQVLADAESGEIELPLYNRVGDLYARLGRQEEAVHYYEQAADRYAEAGLYNNAIALCNKALRYAPGRLHVLRRLGQYSASQGFLTDARSYLMQYAEKSFAAGDHDATFAVLADYARISGDAEIRGYCGHKLHELGRNDEAVAELKRAYALRMGVGDVEAAATLRREILAIEPSALDDEFTSGAIPMPPQPMVLPVPAEELPDLLEEPPPRPFVPGAPARAVAPPQPTLPESDELTPEAGLLDGFQATMLDLGGDQADIGQLPDLEPATEFEPAAIELPRLEDLEAAAEPEADAALLPDLQLPHLSQAAGLEHMGPPAGFEFPALAEELEPEPQPLSGLMSAPVPEEPEAFEDATPLPVLEEPEEFEDATPMPELEEQEPVE
ncbi:MAG: tetratricopeptide repeat protein, partial [Gemmatimonadetes bacterium]|nr:tetratricopeptide repeat protein [Gemmatimonadota bacterium]